MSKKDSKKEDLLRLVKALTCLQNCDECDKTEQQCRLDIRFCINVLLKDKYKKMIVNKEKEKYRERMWS